MLMTYLHKYTVTYNSRSWYTGYMYVAHFTAKMHTKTHRIPMAFLANFGYFNEWLCHSNKWFMLFRKKIDKTKPPSAIQTLALSIYNNDTVEELSQCNGRDAILWSLNCKCLNYFGTRFHFIKHSCLHNTCLTSQLLPNHPNHWSRVYPPYG